MFLKKFIKKNNKLIFWSTFFGVVLYLFVFLKNKEYFSEETIDFASLSKAIDEIVFCEGKKECKGKISNIIQLEDQLGYESFNPLLFTELLEMRKNKKNSLTKEDITKVLENYNDKELESSFKKRTKETFDASSCERSIDKINALFDSMNERYNQEMQAYNTRIAQINAQRAAAKQKFETARRTLKPNEIEWGGKPYNCNQSCGGLSSTWCLNQKDQCKKCMCQCKYHGRRQACPPCNGDRIFDWLGNGQKENCSKPEWAVNGPIIRDDISFSQFWNEPPAPVKPTFPTVNIGALQCQDCRSSIGSVSSEKSKDIAVSQISKCIQEAKQAAQAGPGEEKPEYTTTSQQPSDTTNRTPFIVGGSAALVLSSLCCVLVIGLGLMYYYLM